MLNYDNFDAILFDMDGTIFDSEVVHREAWKITAKQFNQTFTNEMYLHFIGKTTPNCVKLAVEWFNNSMSVEDFSTRYYQNLDLLLKKGVPLKAGFAQYLQTIKKLKKPLAIVTSSAVYGVESNFAHYDFVSAFNIVVTRDDVDAFKPSPEPYLLACEKLNINPTRALAFEDSNTGATAAIEAGCFTVGIPDLVPFDELIAQRLKLQLASFNDLL